MTKRSAYLPLVCIAIPLVFGACATVMNRPVHYIRITADPRINRVDIGQAIRSDSSFYHNPGDPRDYLLARSRDTIRVSVLHNNVRDTLPLVARNSVAYWLNINCNYGLGMLVDRDNLKRYAYPQHLYIGLRDSGIYRRRFAPVEKGTFRMAFGFSIAQFFNIKIPDSRYHTVSLPGMELSGDYFYKDNHYVSLSAGAGFAAPFGERFGKGYDTIANTLYTSLRNNHVIGSFDIGYGISYSLLKWKRETRGDTLNLNQSYRNTGFGLSLSAQYRIGTFFRVGVLYQPMLLANISPKFSYQHYILLNVIWKRPLNRSRGR